MRQNTNLTREKFRTVCKERDDHMCVVPWCQRDVVDVHHIIERNLWSDGGYIKNNGASVCERHHKAAENELIPPQAFWLWIGVENPPTPDGYGKDITKWGEELESPPWEEYREFSKYPSTRHLPFSNVGDKDDTYHQSVEKFIDIPLVITEKLDGGNAMMVKDTENPIRARNGRQANHESFDMFKDIYWKHNIYEKIPENIQVFGEWLYAKHSIHYGCDCNQPCEDVAQSLTSLLGDYGEKTYFAVFGVYNTEYNVWLSWPTVETVAQKLGFPTAPVIRESNKSESMFTNRNTLYENVYKLSQDVINNGGEGLVLRSKYPFHYGEFGERVGKYVRKGHVKTDENHWSKRDVIPNNLY